MKEIIKMYVPYETDVRVRFLLDKCRVRETSLNDGKRLNKDLFIFGRYDSDSIHFSEGL
jgi:hypothetical protein